MHFINKYVLCRSSNITVEVNKRMWLPYGEIRRILLWTQRNLFGSGQSWSLLDSGHRCKELTTEHVFSVHLLWCPSDILCPQSAVYPDSRQIRTLNDYLPPLSSQISSGRVKGALHPSKVAPSQCLPSSDCLRKLLKSVVCESQESTESTGALRGCTL